MFSFQQYLPDVSNRQGCEQTHSEMEKCVDSLAHFLTVSYNCFYFINTCLMCPIATYVSLFLSVPKVTESKKTKSQFLFFSYFWINSLLAGTESAQADPVLAVPPLNTVHCRLYTCAGSTRDEYFQLRTTRDEYLHQPWRPMLLAQKAVWRSALVLLDSKYVN